MTEPDMKAYGIARGSEKVDQWKMVREEGDQEI